MTVVHLLTGERMPKPDPETHLVAAALDRRGASASILSWTDPRAAREADVAVVRTTWDYTSRRDEFVAWCQRAAVAAPVLNPPEVIAWNSHKGYLLELAAAGVPTVPTWVVGRDETSEGVPDALAESGVVIKPAVSSGAFGAGRFSAGDPAATAHLEELLKSDDAIVQPFVPSVPERGERSLIFLGGEISHAVNKQPVGGDFRVQSQYGGEVSHHEPDPADLAVAAAALDTVAAPLLYARVDLVLSDTGPVVMELELIEPELFLGADGRAPERLAELILAGS